MNDPIVIVGSGLAAYGLARELRRAKLAEGQTERPLIIVTRDHGGFYSKPMLSNALSAQKSATSLVSKTAEVMAQELRAQVLPWTQVHSLDAATRTLNLQELAPARTAAPQAEQGIKNSIAPRSITYSELVLATGADPLRLPLAGDAAGRVLSVNDLGDFARFAEQLDGLPQGSTVLILGAGLIGCEFANDLLARGLRPVVVDLAERVLSRLVPPAASLRLQQRLQAAGVRFALARTVTRVDALQVQLDDGQCFEAPLVLSAIGLKPRVGLAQSAGAAVGRGVLTDRHLRSSLPHVHAMGDCAEIDGLLLPYVMPLMHQARALASTLLSPEAPTALNYPAMPVIVKTPACPTVVCPPPPHAIGDWQVLQDDDQGLEAHFKASRDGAMLGFVLMEAATAKRQSLSATLPGPWATRT